VDEFLGMAVAYLHLTPGEFYLMRPGQFYAALDAWAEHEKNKQRFTAELMRMQTADLLNIQLKKKDRIKAVELWRFPWDDEDGERQRPQTDEEIRRHNEEILKRFSRNGG
jgi:hypothetical protein